MGRSERISAQVDSDTKTDFQIAAMRRDMKEAELLRQLIDDFLKGEDIPDEVREYFESGQTEKIRTSATSTAD